MKTRFVSLLALAFAPLLGAAAATPQQPAIRGAAPAAGVPLSPSLSSDVPVPASSRWNLAQLRQSFDLADSDRNGQLTRAESQQLIILPQTFEDLDANHDGVLSRAEYEHILRE
jgi:hypothetical protein